MLLALELDPEPWRSINDGVMGGVSSGGMSESADGLRFEGELSLENNGGFASVRRPVDVDLAKAVGVQLEVRGDGRTYQLRIRQDGRYDGIAWRVEFPTSEQWQKIRLDFDQFAPVFRGRPVVEAGPVAPSEIRQLGFMVADKNAGAFRLDIRSIHFY